MRAEQRVFRIIFVALIACAVSAFWLTELLPMQDYPQILVLARAHRDCEDPTTPFFRTYERGATIGPLLLPILMLRGIAWLSSFETAGKVMWSLYAIGLPLASLHLVKVLRRDPWTVFLVFPLLFSYWVIGGFFAFATAAPLLVLGIACTIRWMETEEPRSAVMFMLVACALHLWHALAFAELMMIFGVFWLLRHYDDLKSRMLSLLPLVAPLILFGSWLSIAVLQRGAASRAPTWPDFFENASLFFDYIGPNLPETIGVVAVLTLLLGVFTFAKTRSTPTPGFRVRNPVGWLALVAALLYLVLPASCFGVEGIGNRQPWLAALFLALGFGLPARRNTHTAFIAATLGIATVVVFGMARRFAAFGTESGGASRLIDRMQAGDTLLAPVGFGSTASFPSPARPLIALELYATARFGGLPESSFAGYDVNIVRYAHGRNPMPAISLAWRTHPGPLRRYDYLLLREPDAPIPGLVSIARDGDWHLYGVCGSRSRPSCH